MPCEAALPSPSTNAREEQPIPQYSADDFLLRRKRLLRIHRANAVGATPLRIAILGGTTTHELAELLELLLLVSGFAPVLHQSEYGRYYEDAVLDTEALEAFRPDIVYIYTSYRNTVNKPPVPCSDEEHAACVAAECNRYRQIWASLGGRMECQIIQNNFELPPIVLFGNMDGVVSGGRTRFLLDLNTAFATEARANTKLLIQDLHSLSASIGMAHWFDWNRWYSSKMLYTQEATLAIARSMTAMVKAIYGRSRKVLVLDLDNTLWGGVIGDDGVDRIQLGRETPLAEAYTAFQEYCLDLRSRGVLLAVCSKNDEAIARSGFDHPSSVLKLEHFAAFKANWNPKHENLLEIAQELSLGVDSFVFVDDNPAERAIVEAQLPGVAVPDVGNEVEHFIPVLEAARYFEPAALSQEDFQRAAMYTQRAESSAMQSRYADYGEYLDSLQMVAEIAPFKPVYLERIAQLTNKTNQFNLTTQRCTLAEITGYAEDPQYLTLYGRLEDKFGDNGLVTVLLGRADGDAMQLDLWLMSCRILKRDMELAVLDELARRARAMGLRTLVGTYRPTKKNGMVADHYAKLGFARVAETPDGMTTWQLDLDGYTPRNTHIDVRTESDAAGTTEI
jgi:FkbH-like protein